MIALPPSAPAVHEIVSVSAIVDTTVATVGACGTVVTVTAAAETALDVPAAFVRLTLTVYEVLERSDVGVTV